MALFNFKRKEKREKSETRYAEPVPRAAIREEKYNGPMEVWMTDGPTFRSLVPADRLCEIKKVEFGDGPVKPHRENYDVSLRQDGSVIAWYEYETMYVTSKHKGVKIIAPADCSEMFAKYPLLETVDFKNFDTREAESFSHMFCDSARLRSLDLSGFDTSNVTNMGSVFGGCERLESVDFTGWNTRKVKFFTQMFTECKRIKRLDIGSFEGHSAMGAVGMFSYCHKLEYVDMGRLKFRELTEEELRHLVAFHPFGIKEIFFGTPSMQTLICRDKNVNREYMENPGFNVDTSQRFVCNPDEWKPAREPQYRFVREQDDKLK